MGRSLESSALFKSIRATESLYPWKPVFRPWRPVESGALESSWDVDIGRATGRLNRLSIRKVRAVYFPKIQPRFVLLR